MKEKRYILPEVLQSLIAYVDKNILKKKDPFEAEWNRSISVEEFRMQCKNKLEQSL